MGAGQFTVHIFFFKLSYLTNAILYRPTNYQELFNLRHSSLRNVIEHIFGVAKCRFCLLAAASEYSLRTQSKIPAALAALHNFISIWDPDDIENGQEYDDDSNSMIVGEDREDTAILPENLGSNISPTERLRAGVKRDEIAKAMWADYVEELHIRGEL